MSNAPFLWLLGHKIRVLPTDDSYGLVEIVTPAGMQGPPPHFHKDENEFIFVAKGTLDVICDGVWSRAGSGTFTEIPSKTVHTFVNNSDEDVVWITGWRPKGFQKFFTEFGINSSQPDALAKSMSPDVIARVMKESEDYGMFVRA